MSKDSYFYFLKPPGFPASQKYHFLGRIVKNYANPTWDYTPNTPPRELITFPAEPLVSNIRDVRTVLKSTSEITAGSAIESMMSFSRKTETINDLAIEGESIEVLRLQQHGDTFELLKRAPEVVKKLKKMLSVGGKVYFVTGVMIWRKGSFSRGAKETRTSTVATRMAGIGTGGRSETGLTDESGNQSQISGTLDEAQIVAIEYRLIKRNLLGAGKKATLQAGQVRYVGGNAYEYDVGSDESSSEDENDPFPNLSITDEHIEGSIPL